MGILYIIYKGDVSRKSIKDLCQRSVYKTQGTNEDHIGLRPKVCISVLGILYSKTKNIDNDINSIPSINGQTNKTVKPDIGTVFTTLYKSCIEQLGIVVTSYIIYIQHYTAKKTKDITI